MHAVPRLVWLLCLREGRFAAAGLAALVLLAITVRAVPTALVPSVVWPDEVFQASEQAHRLVYGSGLVPWEFQFGARSWLLPGAIAGLMELARIAGDGPDYYLPLIAIAFAGLAALPVVCCFLWCRPLFGLTGALVAGMAYLDGTRTRLFRCSYPLRGHRRASAPAWARNTPTGLSGDLTTAPLRGRRSAGVCSCGADLARTCNFGCSAVDQLA